MKSDKVEILALFTAVGDRGPLYSSNRYSITSQLTEGFGQVARELNSISQKNARKAKSRILLAQPMLDKIFQVSKNVSQYKTASCRWNGLMNSQKKLSGAG